MTFINTVVRKVSSSFGVALLIIGMSAVWSATAATGLVVTTLATDSKINNAEKADVVVAGLIDANATETIDVGVTLTDTLGVAVSATTTVPINTGTFSISGLLNATGLADGNIGVSVMAIESITPVPQTIIVNGVTKDTVIPTLVSAKVTAGNQFTVVFSEAVSAVAGDFTNLAGGLAGRTVTGISGSGTATVVLTFDGSAVAVNATGAVDIAGTVTDLHGNPLVALPAQALTDGQAPAFSAVSPATGAFIRNVTTSSQISYTLSESLASGQLLITQTGGTADGASPHTCTLTGNALSQGTRVIDLSDTVNSCTVAQTLVSNAVYTFEFSGTDGSNPAVTVTNTGVTFDTTLPTFTAERTGVNTILVTFSENVSASDTATAAWTLDAGSPVVSVTQPAAANTLTITTTGPNDTFTTPTVIYHAPQGSVLDLAGNEVADLSAALASDKVAPVLSTVTIASNNGTSTAVAKVGDTVTVSITSSEPIGAPTVTILGRAAVVVTASSTSYTATVTTLAGDTEGVVPFSISFSDTQANAGVAVTATTNGSSVTFDKTGPVLAITAPSAASFVKGTAVITFTNNETNTPQCSANALAFVACTSGVTTLSNLSGFDALADGAVTLNLRDTDTAGNSSAVNISVNKDASAPLAPGLPTTTSGPLINDAEETAGFFVVAPLGTSGAVAGDTLELLLGGAVFPTPLTQVLTGTDITNGFFTFTIATNQLGADGAKSITSRVTDIAGNVGAESSALLLTLDTVAPTASITYSTSTPVKSGTALTITATFSEDMEFTAPSSLAISGANTLGATAMTRTDATHYTILHTVGAGDGTATVALSAGTDLAGNGIVSAPTSGSTFVVDNTVPTLSSVTIASNNANTTLAKTGDTVTISFTSSEAITTPSGTISGEPAVIASLGGNNYTASFTMIGTQTEGAVTFSIGFTDLAGNPGTSVTATTNGSAVTFDRSAPVLTEFAPISTPNPDSTPNYSFVSNEAGPIVYGGDCSSATNTAAPGVNAITLALLADGPHSNCTITVTDATGNVSTPLTLTAFTVDTTAPTITSVDTTTASGSYKAGTVIPVTVTFSENVTSTGNVTVTLSTGSACTFAVTNASSGSCNYTVLGGETSADLNAVVSGTIADLATNPLVSFTPGTSLATNKDIVIDTTAPTVVSVTTAKPDGAYKAGEVIDFTVTLSETVTVTGNPTLALNSGGSAIFNSGSGSSALTFRYTVLASENSADLDYVGTGSLALAGGTIADTATNAAVLTLPAPGAISGAQAIVIDTTAPSATGLPTAVAGPFINAAEHTAGFDVVAPLPTSGSLAVAGDTLELLRGGSPFPTPLTRVLTGGDIVAGSFTFTVASGQLGADGAKSITSRVTDVAGNAGAESSALALTLDTSAPSAPVVTSIAGDNKINNNEKSAILLVGTAEADALITGILTDTGGRFAVATQQLSGGGTAYSLSLNGTIATPGALQDGVITPSVAVTDAAGNISASTTLPAVLQDTIAPAVPVVALSNPVNIANVTSSAITGTGEATASILYSITGGGTVTGVSTVSGGGAISITGLDLSTLTDGTLSLGVSLTDSAGNTSATGTASATKDVVTPTVLSVTSTTASGSYKAGVVIPLTVTFSEPVTSTGNITVTLDTGSACTFTVTNASTGSCDYTVLGGETSADLDATVSGTVADQASNPVTSFVPGATLSSAKDIVIDTTAPTIVSVTTAKPDGFYKAGEIIDFTVTTSETVTVTGNPTLAINSGGSAIFNSGSGSTALTFRYTVLASENSADLDYVGTGSLALAGGTILDVATNATVLTLPAPGAISGAQAIVVDTTAPTATSLPTAVAGPFINAQEHTAGFDVVASLGTSGAVAGDTLELLRAGSPFPTPLTRVLTGGDIIAGSFTFTVASGQLGADGAKSITSRVTDQALNVGAESSALALTLDTVAPTAPVISSIGGDNKVNNSEKAGIIVAGSAEADALLTAILTDSAGSIKVGTQQLTGGATAISITLDGTSATPSAFIDGVITPSVSATDAAGNISASTTLPAVLQDTIAPAAPVVSLTNPINAGNVTSVAVTGTGEGATAVLFDITGGANVTGTSTVSVGGAISVTGINLSSLTDGTVSLAVSLTDTAGNTSATGTASATKDVVLPVFSSTTPATSSFINNVTSASLIGFTLSENLSSGTTTITRTSGTADGASPHVCVLTGTALTAGAHTLNLADTVNSCVTAQTLVDGAVYTISFAGTDAVFNPSATVTATGVTFDITAPTVTISAPLPSISTGTSLAVSVGTSEIATCSLVLDGVSSAMTGAGSTSHSASLSSLSLGTHTLAVSCADQASNTTLTATQNFTAFSTSGSTLTATSSNVVLSSPTTGQALLPSGINSLLFGGSSLLDISSNVSSVSEGSLVLAGTSRSLSSMTTGDLVGVNLSTPLTVGNQTFSIGKGIVLGSTGEEAGNITLSHNELPGTTLTIPSGTAIFAPSTWNGTFRPGRATTTTGSAPSGFSVAGEISFGADVNLIFSRPAVITFASSTGNYAFKPAGSSQWVALSTCGGTFASPTSPAFHGECVITNGTDTKIVTYHLTSFGLLTALPPVVSGGNGPVTQPVSGGGGGGGGGIILSTNGSAGFLTQNLSTNSNGPVVGSVTTTTPSTGTVLGAKTFRFTRNLSLGSRGADVTELQKILVAQGFLKVAPTGYFGPQTRNAVRLYQAKYKISVVGSVGPLTRAQLNK